MIGQFIYTRHWYAYGNNRKNVGTDTAALTDGILDSVTKKSVLNALSEDFNPRNNLPEGEGVRNVLINGRSTLRVYHPYPDVTVVSRTTMIVDDIVGDRRAAPFAHGFIITHDDQERFIDNPAQITNKDLFETYEAVRDRSNSDSALSLDESRATAFESFFCEAELEILTRAGFTRDTFIPFYAALINEIGRTNRENRQRDGKIALILPRDAIWGEDPIAEKFIQLLFTLLPAQSRARFGAVSYWNSDVRSPNIAEIQLVISVSSECGRIVETGIPVCEPGKEKLYNMPKEQSDFAAFIWDCLVSGDKDAVSQAESPTGYEALDCYTEYSKKLLGEQYKNIVSLMRIEAVYLFMQTENGGFEPSDCVNSLLAVSRSFVGYIGGFPHVEKFTEECMAHLKDVSKKESAIFTEETDSAICKILSGEKAFYSYFDHAMNILCERFFDGKSVKEILKLFIGLYSDRRDATEVPESTLYKTLKIFDDGNERKIDTLLRAHVTESDDEVVRGFVDLAKKSYEKPDSDFLQIFKKSINTFAGFSSRKSKFDKKDEVILPIILDYAGAYAEQDESGSLFPDLAVSALLSGNSELMQKAYKKINQYKTFLPVILDRLGALVNEREAIPANDSSHYQLIYDCMVSEENQISRKAIAIYVSIVETLRLKGRGMGGFYKNQQKEFDRLFRRDDCQTANIIRALTAIENHRSAIGIPLVKEHAELLISWYPNIVTESAPQRLMDELGQLFMQYWIAANNEIEDVYTKALQMGKNRQLEIFLFVESIKQSKEDNKENVSKTDKIKYLYGHLYDTLDPSLQGRVKLMDLAGLRGLSHIMAEDYLKLYQKNRDMTQNSIDILEEAFWKNIENEAGLLKKYGFETKKELVDGVFGAPIDQLSRVGLKSNGEPSERLLQLSEWSVRKIIEYWDFAKKDKSNVYVLLEQFKDIDENAKLPNCIMSLFRYLDAGDIYADLCIKRLEQAAVYVKDSLEYAITVGYIEMYRGIKLNHGLIFDVNKMLERMRTRVDTEEALVVCIDACKTTEPRNERHHAIRAALKRRVIKYALRNVSFFMNETVAESVNKELDWLKRDLMKVIESADKEKRVIPLYSEETASGGNSASSRQSNQNKTDADTNDFAKNKPVKPMKFLQRANKSDIIIFGIIITLLVAALIFFILSSDGF